MPGTTGHPNQRSYRMGLKALFVLTVLMCSLASTAPAMAISRATVLARAQSWIDIPVRYSQTHYYKGYRTDCSGFTSMAWKTTRGGHAISYSTRSLHSIATSIPADALLPGDAMVKYNYHAQIFYGWLDASHTYYVVYEQTGPNSKITVQNMADNLARGYIPYRRKGITNGPKPWNAIANPSFDTWSRGGVIWWSTEGDRWGSPPVTTQTAGVAKSSKWALRLMNASGRTRDLVGIKQTAKVTTGTPYALSLWASTPAEPAGLTLRLEFFAASGASLGSTYTTGARCSIGSSALGLMSLNATAPATATSATVTVRLAGGVDASGTAGTTAVVDEVHLYDRSPVSASASISNASIKRAQTVSIAGTVTAPVPYGTVRIYVTRPGATKAVALADKVLVKGTWSLGCTAHSRGTYSYTVKYLGYGPYGPVTSRQISLDVR